VLSNQVLNWLLIHFLELPHLYFIVIASTCKSARRKSEFRFVLILWTARKHCRICRGTPTYSINTFWMSHKAKIWPWYAFLSTFCEYVYSTFRSAGSKYKSILPRSPGNTIDRFTKLLLMNNIFPVSLLIFAPNFDFIIIPTRCNHWFIFWMCPSNLPCWSIMSLKCLGVFLCAIWLNYCYLQKPVAITWSKLCSIVIKLAIVYSFLVLRFKGINFSRFNLTWVSWHLTLHFRVSFH
jgi:hypothetical protein